MKVNRIGLILSGGGARGAYQIGIFLAMKKYRLTSKITAISSGSIGSFNALLFLTGDYKRAYEAWKQMSLDLVLSKKKDNLFNKLPRLTQGMFSRDGLTSYIKQNYNLEEILKTDIDVYFAASKIIKNGYGPLATFEPEYFKVSNTTEDFIIKCLLANSAIPYLFDSVKINGNNYTDCMKSDNEPLEPIKNADVDLFIVVPLTKSHEVRKFQNLSKPVIDFRNEELERLPLINMIDFDIEKVDKYLSLGYATGVTILRKLYELQILEHGLFTKKNEGESYYSLQSLGLSISLNRIFSYNEIVEDVLKGVRK